MLDLIIVALSQAAAGPPAEAPVQTPTAQEEQVAPAAPVSENERNRRRCRIETVTGSRMGRQVCLSRAEEEALAGEGRHILERAMRMWDNQSSPGGAGSAGGGGN